MNHHAHGGRLGPRVVIRMRLIGPGKRIESPRASMHLWSPTRTASCPLCRVMYSSRAGPMCVRVRVRSRIPFDEVLSNRRGTNAIRDLLAGQPVGTDIWIALAWCVALLVVAYSVAMVIYRRKIS